MQDSSLHNCIFEHIYLQDFSIHDLQDSIYLLI